MIWKERNHGEDYCIFVVPHSILDSDTKYQYEIRIQELTDERFFIFFATFFFSFYKTDW